MLSKIILVLMVLSSLVAYTGSMVSFMPDSLGDSGVEISALPPKRGSGSSPASPAQKLYEDGVLLAAVDSEEDAQFIAACYGITLEGVADGLARFTTEEDIESLIQLGRDNGWPPVQPNYLYHPF